MNFCIFTGRLGRDPELKKTKSGKSICTFSISVSRRVKNADGQYITDWIDMCAWNARAEFICANFHKGDGIICLTNAEQRKWVDQEGKSHSNIEFQVLDVEFPTSKKNSAQREKNDVPEGFNPVDDPNEPLPF